jgi:hypothetical protein
MDAGARVPAVEFADGSSSSTGSELWLRRYDPHRRPIGHANEEIMTISRRSLLGTAAVFSRDEWTKILFVSGCVLFAAPAFAAPPPGADASLAPWFHSLRVPGTQGNEPFCCDISDCRNYPVRADGTHYQVFFDDRWLIVPKEAVSDRTDNPTGHYVTCIQRDHWTSGVPDGPHVLCLFKAPGT